MKTRIELSIIIPVYNEAENIRKTLFDIKKHIKTPNEIIVVYDSDRDSTVPVLKHLKRKYKNLHPLKNKVAKGPSGAIRSGLSVAKGEKILVMMADLCDDVTQVDKMASMIPKKYDIVCPSRYAKGGRQELNARFKVGLPKTAGYLIKLLTYIPTNDPTNSYKMYSNEVIKKINLKSTISFSVTLEIIVKAYLLNARIKEIPTIWKDRQHGKTNFKLFQSLIAYTPWLLLSLTRNRFFNISPLFKSII